MILTSVLWTSITKAEISCDQVLQKCDQTVKAQRKELELSDLAIKQSQDSLMKLTQELETEKNKSSAFYRNPFFLIGIGLIGGVLIAK